jgi:hypothetical protein
VEHQQLSSLMLDDEAFRLRYSWSSAASAACAGWVKDLVRELASDASLLTLMEDEYACLEDDRCVWGIAT